MTRVGDYEAMTKGEMRAARKAARAAGRKLTGALRVERYADAPRDDAHDGVIYTDSRRGQRALERWAKRCYDYDRD